MAPRFPCPAAAASRPPAFRPAAFGHVDWRGILRVHGAPLISNLMYPLHDTAVEQKQYYNGTRSSLYFFKKMRFLSFGYTLLQCSLIRVRSAVRFGHPSYTVSTVSGTLLYSSPFASNAVSPVASGTHFIKLLVHFYNVLPRPLLLIQFLQCTHLLQLFSGTMVQAASIGRRLDTRFSIAILAQGCCVQV